MLKGPGGAHRGKPVTSPIHDLDLFKTTKSLLGTHILSFVFGIESGGKALLTSDLLPRF